MTKITLENVELLVVTEPLEWTKVLEKARKQHDEIIMGKEGRWFDPGEYEYLKQQWFDNYALKFIQWAESYRKALEA